MKPMPVIAVTSTTRVTHNAAPWRAWVHVRRGFSRALAATYVFDPPFARLMSGGPNSKRGPWRSRPVLP